MRLHAPGKLRREIGSGPLPRRERRETPGIGLDFIGGDYASTRGELDNVDLPVARGAGVLDGQQLREGRINPGIH